MILGFLALSLEHIREYLTQLIVIRHVFEFEFYAFLQIEKYFVVSRLLRVPQKVHLLSVEVSV